MSQYYPEKQPDQQITNWAGLNVLITGGSGFIGSHLCHRLSTEGCAVHVTSRQIVSCSTTQNITWWQADLADLAETRHLLTKIKPDIIFHLAGAVGASPDLNLVLPTYHSLLTSTINVLLIATELGCKRVVLTGSLTEPRNHAEPTPQSPYAAAKWAAGGYTRMFHTLYDTPAVILRPFMTYGPAQAPSKLIPSVILSLLRGEAPKLSSGKTQADWIYIADVIEGFLRAGTASGILGHTIDLGTGKLDSIFSIVEQIIAIMESPIKPLYGALPDRPGENEIAAATVSAFELIGWKATTTLEQGLRQTVEWYKAKASGHA